MSQRERKVTSVPSMMFANIHKSSNNFSSRFVTNDSAKRNKENDIYGSNLIKGQTVSSLFLQDF